jgi:hypothetical protein
VAKYFHTVLILPSACLLNIHLKLINIYIHVMCILCKKPFKALDSLALCPYIIICHCIAVWGSHIEYNISPQSSKGRLVRSTKNSRIWKVKIMVLMSVCLSPHICLASYNTICSCMTYHPLNHDNQFWLHEEISEFSYMSKLQVFKEYQELMQSSIDSQ